MKSLKYFIKIKKKLFYVFVIDGEVYFTLVVTQLKARMALLQAIYVSKMCIII